MKKVSVQMDLSKRFHVVRAQKFVKGVFCVKCLTGDLQEFLEYVGVVPKPGTRLSITVSREKK